MTGCRCWQAGAASAISVSIRPASLERDVCMNRRGPPWAWKSDSSCRLGWGLAAMTRPCSMDLRERAVTRVLAGESVRSVATALSISAASAGSRSTMCRSGASFTPRRRASTRRASWPGSSSSSRPRSRRPTQSSSTTSQATNVLRSAGPSARPGKAHLPPALLARPQPIEPLFAKLKHLLRAAAERSKDPTWQRIGNR